ncbi:chorismate lyase [Pseudoalteromonas sp. OOF1S-7]|uniref:chorismate--pyruvate lyase family protein n=1 Tax=Pseudoalteromonas sp. OOF1S-7 TaxID=2917757 RepID=UPI001EF75296|nr:chorismate lyase [Pseudoalteromonas sp. OOF1S-7]MCG7535265.1 chorismate lyase [Pseudoalteromonas sp. OOF1S-7]
MRSSWEPLARHKDIPDDLRPLLCETGSLTALLRLQCRILHVEVLSEQVLQLEGEVQAILGCDSALCREVVLYCDDIPVVYGQSWLPDSAVALGLNNIGTTPLGERLFDQQAWQRGAIEVATLDKKQLPSFFPVNETLNREFCHARRSVFTRQNSKVLVCEIFLNGVKV